MRSIADGLVGVIARQNYRVEIWKANTPRLIASSGQWVYITKIHHNGEIGERSIGLPESDLPELISLLEEILH